MFNQIKLGIKLWKYAISAKSQIVCATIFFLLGAVWEIGNQGTGVIGGFYIVLSSIFITQLIVSVDFSTMVQASSYKKKLQTSMPVLVSTPVMLVTYTFLALIRVYFFQASSKEESRLEIKFGLLLVGVLLCLTSIYMGICFKYFLAAMVVLELVIVPILVIGMDFDTGFVAHIPMAAIVAAGYGLILLGQFLAYLLSRLAYRKDLSKYAFGAAMRRATQ
jgi:hypothetical protein